jgi:hypothetical protein
MSHARAVTEANLLKLKEINGGVSREMDACVRDSELAIVPRSEIRMILSGE